MRRAEQHDMVQGEARMAILHTASQDGGRAFHYRIVGGVRHQAWDLADAAASFSVMPYLFASSRPPYAVSGVCRINYICPCCRFCLYWCVEYRIAL